MKSVLIFFLAFLAFSLKAQVPEPALISLRVYTGDGGDGIGTKVEKTSDGGFILGIGSNSSTGTVVDSFCNSPHNRAIFAKYSADGVIKEWDMCRKSTWGDTGWGFVFQTVDSKYVFGGTASSGNSWVIRKEDASGNILWTKGYGGTGSQMLHDMISTEDGGYVLFGSSYGGDGDIGFHYGGSGTRDFWLLRVDANGNKLWSKVYGGTQEDLAASIMKAPSGGFYLVGSTGSSDFDCTGNKGRSDVYIARVNTAGEMIWHKCIGGSGNDGGGEGEACRGITNGKGGVLIATGTRSSDGDVTHKINDIGRNVWLVDIDSNGSIEWDNCYGGGGDEYANSLCIGTDGGIWLIGCSRLVGGQVNVAYGASSDAYVIHTDSNGNFLNAKVLGSSGQDAGYMIYPLSDGSVLAGGYYGRGDGVFPTADPSGVDAFLVKFANWSNNVATVESGSSISVFPNPASERINIATSNNSIIRVIVTDIVGSVVYQSDFFNSIQIRINNWTPGTYLVQLIDEDGCREVKKVTVQ
jgi:hypothetical protein